jgi:soluble lytic murein transglycosylase-like protein
MMKDMMKGYMLVKYQWVLLTKLVAWCLFVIIGLGVVFVLTGSEKSAKADVPVAVVRHDAWDVNKAAKPAILQWMRNKSEMPEQILSNIYDAAVKSSNPDLIIAVCLVESSFNPNAKSSKGAMGLMGIVPKVWLDELKKQGIVKERRDLYMIPHNIASGAYVLGKYLSTTNNLEKALLQYVGGDPYYPGKVMQALGEIYLARTDRTG